MKVFTHITGDKEIDKLLSRVSDAYTPRVITQALRRAATPVVKAVRAATPVGDYDHFVYGKGGVLGVHNEGDLRKSIGKITGKNKRFPTIYVGPRVKRKWKYAGYIGEWVENGNGTFEGRRFMKKGYESSKSKATGALRNSLLKVLKKHVK